MIILITMPNIICCYLIPNLFLVYSALQMKTNEREMLHKKLSNIVENVQLQTNRSNKQWQGIIQQLQKGKEEDKAIAIKQIALLRKELEVCLLYSFANSC